MIIHCAWCESILGEKDPLEDRRVTTGMCPECYAAARRQAGLHLGGGRPRLGISRHARDRVAEAEMEIDLGPVAALRGAFET